jgi:ketosteroid isomerase-like protein
MRSDAALMLIMPFLLVLPMRGTPESPAPEQAKTAACTSPEYHQLDFWLGDWDVFDVGAKTPDAHVRVEAILDGCVVHEIYEDTTGQKGQSFSIYDAPRKVWHQSWVTNRGQLLVIEGNLHGDEMVLSGSQWASDDVEVQIRGVWKPADGGVRESAVKSSDGGKTWKTWFDLMYRKRSATASAVEDEKKIRALDTDYQAAVKDNDAKTMDRILADDFILVTGKGKTFTKSELLDEARAATTNYEHQEDTEQTVRVWGDTAVITAKLWEKGTDKSRAFDSTLWFSDTYVRTPAGWRYVFGQASSPLPQGH